MTGHNLAFSKSSELLTAARASGLSPLEELLGTESFLEFKVRNPGATGQVSFSITGQPLAESVNRTFGPSSQNFFGGGVTSRSIRSSSFIDPKFLNRRDTQAPTTSQLSAGAQQRTQAQGTASTILAGRGGPDTTGLGGRGTVAFKTLSGF